MRSPIFADKCADPRVIRAFTLFKLLLLLLLIGLLLLLLATTIKPPILELPAMEVLSLPVLVGSGTAGSRVEVTGNDRLLGHAVVGSDGRWRLVPQPPLAPAAYNLVARAVNKAGEVVAAGPEGEGQLTVVGLPTLMVAAGNEDSDRAELHLSGSGTPSSILRLVHNKEIGQRALVDDAGHWAMSLWVDKPSQNEFYVQLLARDGSILGRSNGANYDIGFPIGLAPGPSENPLADLTVERIRYDDPIRAEIIGLIAGWLDVEGTGRPSRVIEIYREGQLAGQATVDPDGRWSLRFFVSLLPGEHSYLARMVEADGSLVRERSFTVPIPAPPSLAVEGGLTDVDEVLLSGQARPDRPVTLLINGQVQGTVQADDQGVWRYPTRLPAGEYEIVALDGSLESDRGQLMVAMAVPVIVGQSTDDSGQLVSGLYGHGRPNTHLEILEDDVTVGQAAVNPAGDWRCACTLPPGEHVLSVREIDEPQRASQPAPLQVFNSSRAFRPGPADPSLPPFRCPEGSPPGQIQDTQYIIGCGESMSVITSRLGVTAEQLLAYNPQLSDPPRFYFGQIINIPQTAACFDAPG